MMKKALIIFLTSTTSLIAHAETIDITIKQNPILQQYDCPDQESALVCNNKCTPYKTMTRYTANPADQSVEFTHFKSLQPYFNAKLDNCQVTDNFNWSCASKSEHIETRLQMKNGLYTATNINHDMKTTSFYCAKP